MGTAAQEMPLSNALTPVLLQLDRKTSDFLKQQPTVAHLSSPK